MRRRGFLTILGAAASAPLLPAVPARAAGAAGAGVAGAATRTGYQKLLYGFAKFHAQTRASLTAEELIPRLGVNARTAEALMGRLAADGVVKPALGAAPGVMRGVRRIGAAADAPEPTALGRRLARWSDGLSHEKTVRPGVGRVSDETAVPGEDIARAADQGD